MLVVLYMHTMQVDLQETIQLFRAVDLVPALAEPSSLHDILLKPLCRDTRLQIHHHGIMGQIAWGIGTTQTVKCRCESC